MDNVGSLPVDNNLLGPTEEFFEPAKNRSTDTVVFRSLTDRRIYMCLSRVAMASAKNLTRFVSWSEPCAYPTAVSFLLLSGRNKWLLINGHLILSIGADEKRSEITDRYFSCPSIQLVDRSSRLRPVVCRT